MVFRIAKQAFKDMTGIVAQAYDVEIFLGDTAMLFTKPLDRDISWHSPEGRPYSDIRTLWGKTKRIGGGIMVGLARKLRLSGK